MTEAILKVQHFSKMVQQMINKVQIKGKYSHIDIFFINSEPKTPAGTTHNETVYSDSGEEA